MYVHNADQVSFAEAGRALGVAAVIGAVLYGFCRLVFGSTEKADVLASALVLVFFCHGHAVNLFTTWFGRWASEVPTVLEVLGFLGLMAWVVRRRLGVATFAKGITSVFAGLFLVASLMLLGGEVTRSGFGNRRDASTGKAGGRMPDIYYLILDGYGREDTLREYVGFDNAPFLQELRRRGFFIGKQSRSNYGQTLLSLASSLNLELLDPTLGASKKQPDFGVATRMVKRNEVMSYLHDRNYEIVAIPSGFQGTDPMPQVDATWCRRKGTLSEFERMIFDLTVLARLAPASVVSDSYDRHRETILTAFECLRTSVAHASTRPSFVFTHVVAPHPPFVFDETGASAPHVGPFNQLDGKPFYGRRAAYQKGYGAQLRFLNTQVLKAIDGILSDSAADNRPIILIQGDHGPASHYDPKGLDPDYVRERMAVLNAWYVPPGVELPLYDSVTPVNAFRLIFNALFDAGLPLAEDRSYYSTYDLPYAFREVDEDGNEVMR